MVSVTVVIKNRISVSSTLTRRLSATAIIYTNTNISESCPTITEIDGGNTGSDAQFIGINGILDGGGA